MTRKKITKKKRKVAGRKAKKKPIPGWLLLSLGILFGLVIAVFGYVKGWVPKVEQEQIKPQKEVSQPLAKVEDKSDDLKIKKTKDYDFYTALQDMEVVISSDEIIKAEPRVPSNFFLQLGAFKDYSDAENLKAQVAFSGHIAYIQTIEIKDTQWHRIRVGPMTSGRKADVIKRNLEKNGFNALIIKEK